MTEPFTPEQIDRLSGQIDQQLLAARSADPTLTKTNGGGNAQALAKQREAIEQATGEDADRFLTRFRDAARRDVCEPGGVIYKQWHKWRDVTNKDVLNSFGAILVGMGLSGGGLQIAAVALAVYVLYLGVQAFCAEPDGSQPTAGD